jgi:Ca-activated chloride channel family protein
MLRPLVALVAVSLASSPARAAGLPSHFGMYTPQGTPLAMLDSKIAIVVRGPIVEATITQRFRNDADRAVEATYIFPLPDDAAVSAMAMSYGARTIHAAIEPRADAQRRYEQAIAAGVGAALLDQERPDVFTQTVSAIPARGTVEVTIRFDATARYASDGTWQLVLPLVVAPRYVPGAASGRPTTGSGHAPDTDRAPDASRVTPHSGPDAGGPVAVDLAFADEVDAVTSPTHELKGQGDRFSFVDPHGDHDAIVRWRAKQQSFGWVERDGDGGFAAVVVAAPPAPEKQAAPRCELLLDQRATQRGDADAALRPLARTFMPACGGHAMTAADVDHALDMIVRRHVVPDLAALLARTKADGRALILVSDGLVADDARVLAAAKKLGAAIHVVGVGPAPNRALLARIATTTGGTLRFATLGDDLPALARGVLADAAAPAAPLAVSWGTLEASDVVPAELPRLGAGQALLVVAHVKQAARANARARGDVFVLSTIDAPARVAGATAPLGPLARRWARMKLDELLGDPRAAAAHAARYGLVSPFTSMVAIGEEVVVQGGVKHTVAVPVSVPAGMRWQEVKRAITVDTTTTVEKTKEAPPPDKVKQPPPPPDQPPPHGKKEQNKDRELENKDAAKRDDRKTTTTPEHKPGIAPKRPKPTVATGGAGTQGQPAQPTTPAKNVETGAATGADDDGEADASQRAPSKAPMQIDVGGTTEVVRYERGYRRRLHLAVGVAGGYASVNGGTSGALGGLVARVEYGRSTRVGVDGALWLVAGLHVQGELLATVSRHVGPSWLELGGGLGLRLGDGAGPAASLSLRVAPWRWRGLAAFGRYDGALRFHASTVDGENTATGGLEWRW